ncbi:hypothetical protein GDO86_002134 [Hymenochirus boettgeri]|uniref:long-chain-fatty-acid--CoA ligase n=1 Tax=Hymenochirus boettgeri TaxID=247094 RepID=A0A8T2KL91_9PIPI|nr:hypothetical protein GDO86_002134 [Hymenochirus boettgeri]
MDLMWVTGLLAGLFALHFLQRRFFPYLWIDARYLWKVVRYGLRIELYKVTGRVVTVVDDFMRQAQRIPDKPFVIYQDQVHTYRDVDRRSNKVARVFLDHSEVKKDDTVAMLMSNEPDFLHVWFGLAKLGCRVAFLNHNVRSRSLLHCFQSCGAKMLVVGEDMLGTLEEILPNLQEDNISVWVMSKDTPLKSVNTVMDKLESVTDEPVPAKLCQVTSIKDATLYIFTSGTTGATCLLKKKFSASQFWTDCKKYNVTVFQYIGELCRYLCNQPVREGEKDHKVRMAVGNGVRTEVWREFIRRFGDIKMCELYGATEGNICFMNHTGKIGAVGRSNMFYKILLPFELIKYDIQKDEPIRNEQGWCDHVKKGETGLLISEVSPKNPFFGYAGNKTHTTKKLLCDVFKKGDVYFNTGDLMVQDYDDFLYFRDRIGDTFRWKGENVATTEVSDIIGMLTFIQEANVYGVPIPDHEGKIGMVSIILKPNETLDPKSVYEQVVTYLPSYAQPRFLRLQETMEVTGTFKQQKFRLVEQGFNPSSVPDPIYFLDGSEKSYVPLTMDIYDRIQSGKIKL